MRKLIGDEQQNDTTVEEHCRTKLQILHQELAGTVSKDEILFAGTFGTLRPEFKDAVARACAESLDYNATKALLIEHQRQATPGETTQHQLNEATVTMTTRRTNPPTTRRAMSYDSLVC